MLRARVRTLGWRAASTSVGTGQAPAAAVRIGARSCNAARQPSQKVGDIARVGSRSRGARAVSRARAFIIRKPEGSTEFDRVAFTVFFFSVRFGSVNSHAGEEGGERERDEKQRQGAGSALEANVAPTEMVVVPDSNEIDREIAFSRYLRITLFSAVPSPRIAQFSYSFRGEREKLSCR